MDELPNSPDSAPSDDSIEQMIQRAENPLEHIKQVLDVDIFNDDVGFPYVFRHREGEAAQMFFIANELGADGVRECENWLMRQWRSKRPLVPFAESLVQRLTVEMERPASAATRLRRVHAIAAEIREAEESPRRSAFRQHVPDNPDDEVLDKMAGSGRYAFIRPQCFPKGARVRYNFPGSRSHGFIGTIVSASADAAWVVFDEEPEQEDRITADHLVRLDTPMPMEGLVLVASLPPEIRLQLEAMEGDEERYLHDLPEVGTCPSCQEQTLRTLRPEEVEGVLFDLGVRGKYVTDPRKVRICTNEECGRVEVMEALEPTAAEIAAAAKEAEPAPTDAQIDAENYKKGHIRLYGLDISIENAKGAERSGTDDKGKRWSVTMPAHYGYVKGTEGKDGDHVDVYIGDDVESKSVWIVDQLNAKTGKFDEHKCLLCFHSRQQAEEIYVAGFSDGKGKERMGGMTEMTVDEFKDWVFGNETDEPLSEADEEIDPEQYLNLVYPAVPDDMASAVAVLHSRGFKQVDDEQWERRIGRHIWYFHVREVPFVWYAGHYFPGGGAGTHGDFSELVHGFDEWLRKYQVRAAISKKGKVREGAVDPEDEAEVERYARETMEPSRILTPLGFERRLPKDFEEQDKIWFWTKVIKPRGQVDFLIYITQTGEGPDVAFDVEVDRAAGSGARWDNLTRRMGVPLNLLAEVVKEAEQRIMAGHPLGEADEDVDPQRYVDALEYTVGSDIEIATREEAEQRAEQDYNSAVNKIWKVEYVSGFAESGDSIDVFGPFIVQVLPETDRWHVLNWNDDYLDPYWEVEVLSGPEEAMEVIRQAGEYVMHGRTYHVPPLPQGESFLAKLNDYRTQVEAASAVVADAKLKEDEEVDPENYVETTFDEAKELEEAGFERRTDMADHWLKRFPLPRAYRLGDKTFKTILIDLNISESSRDRHRFYCSLKFVDERGGWMSVGEWYFDAQLNDETAQTWNLIPAIRTFLVKLPEAVKSINWPANDNALKAVAEAKLAFTALEHECNRRANAPVQHLLPEYESA
jgi:Inorganic Pyrophosphatase